MITINKEKNLISTEDGWTNKYQGKSKEQIRFSESSWGSRKKDADYLDESLVNLERSYLKEISDQNVLNLIKNDPWLSEILIDYIHEIKSYLNHHNAPFKIKIVIQEDPEDLNFKAFIMVINIVYDNISERFMIERNIADSLNTLRKRIINSYGEKITRILNHISFLVIKTE